MDLTDFFRIGDIFASCLCHGQEQRHDSSCRNEDNESKILLCKRCLVLKNIPHGLANFLEVQSSNNNSSTYLHSI